MLRFSKAAQKNVLALFPVLQLTEHTKKRLQWSQNNSKLVKLISKKGNIIVKERENIL